MTAWARVEKSLPIQHRHLVVTLLPGQTYEDADLVPEMYALRFLRAELPQIINASRSETFKPDPAAGANTKICMEVLEILTKGDCVPPRGMVYMSRVFGNLIKILESKFFSEKLCNKYAENIVTTVILKGGGYVSNDYRNQIDRGREKVLLQICYNEDEPRSTEPFAGAEPRLSEIVITSSWRLADKAEAVAKLLGIDSTA